MKRILTFCSIFWLLTSCRTVNNIVKNISTQPTGNVANCPEPPAEPPKININAEAGFYNAFNYQIRDIVADVDTINFQSPNYDFIFCRGNNSWIVQSLTLESSAPINEAEYKQRLAELADPPYQTVECDGKTYQYRVNLDPNPFPDFKQEAQRVVFELILPESIQPQQQVLYTLEQTKQARTGNQLGVPEVSAVVISENRLFWSVFPEQGEGNGGIATIVSYQPETDKITVIQPEEIARQQINDLVISGEGDNLILWMATQISGEGNPYLPSMGLVAYRPDNFEFTSGSIDSYRVRNSPIVGAIPTKLELEGDRLWVGTGNGICQIEWKTIDNPESWSCWRFALMAALPNPELSLYSSLLDETADRQIVPNQTDNTVEVLWWLPQNDETRQGRYEVRSQSAFTVKLDDRGATSWEEYYYFDFEPPVWLAPVFWAGSNWHWQGDRFVRGFDEVSLNLVGGGPSGIGSQAFNPNLILNPNVIRGDLELLELTKDSTEVKYYSGWVEDSLLQPYITVISDERSPQKQPNPLKVIADRF